MKNWLKALTISLTIYIVLILLYLRVELPKKEEIVYKPLSLKLIEPTIEKKLHPTPQPKQIKKAIIPKKTAPKPPHKKAVALKKEKPKKSIEASKQAKKSPSAPLFKMPSLMELNTKFIPPKIKPSQKLKNLYGAAAQHLSEPQIEYLNTYLAQIANITQHYLNRRGSAFLASQLQLRGVLLVEFTLYPNGDMDNFKILKSSSYNLLDKDFQEVIEIVYKDYPLPKVKTPVRFQMSYL
jgi:periplasmic protein TonB